MVFGNAVMSRGLRSRLVEFPKFLCDYVSAARSDINVLFKKTD